MKAKPSENCKTHGSGLRSSSTARRKMLSSKPAETWDNGLAVPRRVRVWVRPVRLLQGFPSRRNSLFVRKQLVSAEPPVQNILDEALALSRWTVG